MTTSNAERCIGCGESTERPGICSACYSRLPRKYRRALRTSDRAQRVAAFMRAAKWLRP